jgi:hypothetical protein
MINLICYILALICFIIAVPVRAFASLKARVNLIALGLAILTFTLVLSAGHVTIGPR